jgi:hypothetical protein
VTILYEMLRLVREVDPEMGGESDEAAPDPLAPLTAAAAGGVVRAARTLLIAIAPTIFCAVRGVLGTAHPDLEDVAPDAAIYLSDRDSERYLLRDVALRSGMDDLACETVVTIIEAAVEALRGGSTIGMPRAEALALIVPPPAPSTPPRPIEALPEGSAIAGSRAEAPAFIVPPAPPTSPPRLPEPPPRHAPESRVRAAAGVHYEGVGIGAPVSIAQGPGVSLIVASRRGTFRPAAWASVSGHFPVTSPADPIGVTLTTGSVRLVPALETSLGSRVTLRLGIGGGADVIPRCCSGLPGSSCLFSVGDDALGSHAASTRPAKASVQMTHFSESECQGFYEKRN